MFKGFFKTESSYFTLTRTYTWIDGLLAVMTYFLILVIYYIMGVLYVKNHVYLGIPVNLFMIVLCLVLVLIRKQGLASLGFTLKNIKKALLTGFLLGIVFTFSMNILPNLLAGGKLIPLNKALYNIFYYFLIIALTEEVVFRGYIQTRMYGLIKNDLLAVTVTGVMFYAMHLPFQMQANGLQFNIINMLILMSLHFLMNFLYRKYNSLAGATIFHGLLDWGGNLLQ